MQYNSFNSQTLGEIKISRLGMGCMRLPVTAPGSEDIDYEMAGKVIDCAYANGINYFDTAIGYHDKGSEPFLGQALKKFPRESFYLATKLSAWFINAERNVNDIIEWQKQRLQTDYFDFYLCHNLNDSVIKGLESVGAYETLCEHKKRGTIKNLGFSFHGNMELLKYVVDKYEWDFAQIQFNYLDAEYSNAMREYELLEKAGIPTVVMEPVRGGSLADLCPEANSLLKDAQPEKSIASWALRYASSMPNVFTTLSGMSSMEQIQDNLATFSDFSPVSDDEKLLLKKAAKLFHEYCDNPCTGCKYCVNACPQSVETPELLKAFTAWKRDKNVFEYREQYEKAAPDRRAQQCLACGECLGKCPQNINIPVILSEICALNDEIGVE